jgi:hypothetical protein
MSNIYRYAEPPVPHYQVPNALDQWLNSISFGELRLLLLIHSEAERKSLSEVILPTELICSRTGIHRTDIGKARRALVDYGLLLVRKAGRQYTYIVCNPELRAAVVDKTSLKAINFDHIPEHVLSAYIETIIKDSKPVSKGIGGHCPFRNHDDSKASFTMDVEKGGIWWCRGCDKRGSLIDLEIYLSEDAIGATISPDSAHKRVRDKLRSLGMGKHVTGKLEATKDIVFRYVDEEGEIITETVRRNGDKSKTFRRRPNPHKPGRYIYDTKGCRSVLYNLPDIQEAYTVIVVEGEPDADRLTKLALRDSEGYIVAVTTNSNGAGNWLPDHSVTLTNKRVILCGDTDKRGREHMEKVKACLESHMVNVVTQVELPLEYKDVSEFLKYRRAKHLAELVGEEWLEPIDDGIADI